MLIKIFAHSHTNPQLTTDLFPSQNCLNGISRASEAAAAIAMTFRRKIHTYTEVDSISFAIRGAIHVGV